MATEGSRSTFSTIASSRAGSGSPYLEAFLRPAETERNAQFERELQMVEEGRKERSQDLAEQKNIRDEERNQRADLEEQRRYNRTQYRQDLADRKQNALEHKQMLQEEAETNAAEAEGKIMSLDPTNMQFDYHAREVLQDPQVKRALTSRHGGIIYKALNDQKSSFLKNLQHYQGQADEAGLSGDVRHWADDQGIMDDQAFSQALETARSAKQKAELAEQQKAQQVRDVAARAAGLEVARVDEKGNITYERPRVKKEDIMQAMNEGMGVENGATPTTPKTSPLPSTGVQTTINDFPPIIP
jgi:hypothetical protein